MKQVIVSFTSYPARISGITRVLDSLVSQTCKPYKIILYLSEEQFEGRKVPVDFSFYSAFGFEIHWCQGDMKSHKKYLYALQEYPDDYVITVDDDFYYDCFMIEDFVRNIDRFPGCVLSRRSHLITSDREGNIASYQKWWDKCLHYVDVPRMDLFAVGCGGVLYPPHIFKPEVFHSEYITRYCPYADDIWLKIMEVLSDVPVVQVKTRYCDIANQEYAQDGLCQNANGNGGNDGQLRNLLRIYSHYQGKAQSLKEKIFSDGMIFEDETGKWEDKDDQNSLKSWTEDVMQFPGIIIYGAGCVAGRMYKVLKRHCEPERFKAFVVENICQNVDEVDGIKVFPYRETDYEDTVCVVIGLADQEEQLRVGQKLLEIGLKNRQIICTNARIQRVIRNAADM